MGVKVKALVSFAGANVSMHAGQEAKMNESLALRLAKCGYIEILTHKQAEVKEKESKRANKDGSVEASQGNTGGHGD